MNALSLLKTLASGFFPLLVYIGAELLFGETIGLLAGIGMGILEFSVSFVKEKKADLFIVADTLLLAALGLLSLLLRNQLFFRIKPALIEVLMAMALTLLLFLPPELLKNYFGRQLKGLTLDERALPGLKRGLVMMVFVLFIHAGLTLWAAFAASAALWGFVSGGLLFIMLGLAFLGQWISGRRSRRGGTQSGEPFFWSLLVLDERGFMLAEKSSTDPRLWDSPARGRASSEADLEARLVQSLARLGISRQATGTEAVPAPLPPISIQPAFVIESGGKVVEFSAASAAHGLGEILARAKPGSTLVLAAIVARARFPKGVDPTERRLWPLSDLVALAAQGRLSPSFAGEIRALASLGRSLPTPEEPSIVTDTNDALI